MDEQERKEELMKSLWGKKAFIYQVNDKHYYLGGQVFRGCSEKEQALFKKYQNELQYVDFLNKRCRYDVSLQQKELVEAFQEITQKEEFFDAKDNCGKKYCQMRNLIFALNDDQIQSIEGQLERYTNVCAIVDQYLRKKENGELGE